ncbi:MAG: PrsW family glutamic-type intramembrane protease [bacterium]|nr:PrsW family glutamic-type intramembrane protease [bacterium]
MQLLAESPLRLTVSLLPVIVFLGVLIFIDSFKLVRFRNILYSILTGCIVAFGCLWINSFLMRLLNTSSMTFNQNIAPTVEEIMKGILLVVLIRKKRIGFMVDASIHGFAIGAGFSIVENIYYFNVHPDPNFLVWIIRGFGTALMHGGVTAIMGIVSKQFSDRFPNGSLLVFLPGLIVAATIHTLYNHFFVTPILSTFGLLIVLPLMVVVVFRSSEKATRNWLGMRMDTDAELLEMINTGRVTESRVGEYLTSLMARFSGAVVADMVCLLRIHLELSIRAKGVLLMREAGFKIEADPEVLARFEEMKYLEKSIGKTGKIAIAPMFHMSDHDLWQLHMLGKK